MYESLDRYLAEIHQYLAVSHDADEILAEIRSHIIEKTENRSGEVNEDSLRTTISAYGRPREVAEKYLEGCEVISPAFKRHLFRYTGILIAFHFTLAVIAAVLRVSMFVFPFFYIPRMDTLTALFYFPMLVVYDFGLVALFLYIATQRKKDVRLPWPRVFRARAGESQLRRPKAGYLGFLLAIFAVGLYLFARYHSIFVYTVNFGTPRSLFGTAASSVLFSLLFLAIIACEIGAYSLRFIANSAWVNVGKNGVILLLLWVVWNFPIRPTFQSVPGLDVGMAGGILLIAYIAIVAMRFLWNLVLATRERPFRRAHL